MREEYKILEKLGLELEPIGVKYGYFPPEGIRPLEQDGPMSLCEIMRSAHESREPFYFSAKSKENCVGKNILGMEPWTPAHMSGYIGEKLGVFQEARCNARLYKYVQHLPEGTVNFVTFARYTQMDFRPDVLIVAAPPAKAERVLRAATYATGELYTSVCSPTIGCSWLFAYPYNEDKINYIIPALVHGPHGRRLYPEDTMLIAIPYRWLPTVLEGLNDMLYDLKGQESVEEYHREFEGILEEMGEKAKRLRELQEE